MSFPSVIICQDQSQSSTLVQVQGTKPHSLPTTRDKMSSRRSMTRDIHESIRMLLGKNTKVLLKVPVKLELKAGEKTENRILVFTPHRLFIVTAKVPSRIDHHFHYLDIKYIESKRPNHIAFTFANLEKSLSFR